MTRQQFALIVALGLFVFSPPLTGGNAAKASDWKSAADENGGSTLSGVLYRNSADTNGSAPYALVDKWGVTRGYVAAAEGVDLESSLGRQVTLQGTIRTLPGGDMPSMKGVGLQAIIAMRPLPRQPRQAEIAATKRPARRGGLGSGGRDARAGRRAWPGGAAARSGARAATRFAPRRQCKSATSRSGAARRPAACPLCGRENGRVSGTDSRAPAGPLGTLCPWAPGSGRRSRSRDGARSRRFAGSDGNGRHHDGRPDDARPNGWRLWLC